MPDCLFIEYPKCSTCQNARKWLEEHNISFTDRHILEQTPTAGELQTWQRMSKLPLSRFFNTSGLRYKALNLKEKLPQMSEAEQFALLASDGMLIKRPLLICGQTVLTGFRPAQWQDTLTTQK